MCGCGGGGSGVRGGGREKGVGGYVKKNTAAVSHSMSVLCVACSALLDTHTFEVLNRRIDWERNICLHKSCLYVYVRLDEPKLLEALEGFTAL